MKFIIDAFRKRRVSKSWCPRHWFNQQPIVFATEYMKVEYCSSCLFEKLDELGVHRIQKVASYE